MTGINMPNHRAIAGGVSPVLIGEVNQDVVLKLSEWACYALLEACLILGDMRQASGDGFYWRCLVAQLDRITVLIEGGAESVGGAVIFCWNDRCFHVLLMLNDQRTKASGTQ